MYVYVHVYTTHTLLAKSLEYIVYMAHSRNLSIVFMKTNNFLDNIHMYSRNSVYQDKCKPEIYILYCLLYRDVCKRRYETEF